MTAKPDVFNPTLFYPFPAGSIPGTDFGDSTLYSGGSGVQLSIDELSRLLSQVRFTDAVLNSAQRKLMDDHQVGWYRGERDERDAGVARRLPVVPHAQRQWHAEHVVL